MSFPLTYIERNLVFNRDQQVWAAYRLQSWHYEYLSHDARLGLLQRLARLFWHLEDLEGQLMLVPRPHGLREHMQQLGETGDKLAQWYSQQAAATLPPATREEMADYDYVLLLRISEAPTFMNDLKSMGRGLLTSPRQFFKNFAGVGDWSISTAQLGVNMDREEQVYLRLNRILKAARLNAAELGQLVHTQFDRGERQPARSTGWQQPITLSPDEKFVTPDQGAMGTLADGDLYLDTPHRVRMVNPAGVETLTAFAALADVPDDMPFPGGEWLFGLHDLPFPVEVCLRWRAIGHRDALNEVRKRRLEINDQDEHTRHSGQDLPLNLLEAQEDALLLEHDLKQRKNPLLDLTVLFGVSAQTPEQLAIRLQSLKEYFLTQQMTVEVPGGDQLAAFTDFLPATPHTLRDYVLRLPPEAVAASMLLASKALGDDSGPYIGRVGLLNRPVYLDPSLPPRINRSASMAFLGSLGGGKSFTANLLTYLAITARGARALILDPKGERGHWPNALPELRDQTRVLTLSGSPADRGKLDPFVIARTLASGDQREIANLAVSVLCFLTGAHMGDNRFLGIMEAVERVAARPQPTLTAVLDELERMGQTDEAISTLARYLRVMSNQAYASLLFGRGDEQGLDLSAQVNILQVQHLQLPPTGKPRDEYTMQELISVGLMQAVTAYAARFASQDRGVFKVVLMDEAWALLGSSQGKALVSQLLRTGRSLNTAIYLVTQNCADLLDETIRNNLGAKFIFRSQDADEIGHVLQFLNLPDSPEAAYAVRNLETGQALLQDLQGRVGMVRMDAVLPHVVEAFNTAPAPAEVTA